MSLLFCLPQASPRSRAGRQPLSGLASACGGPGVGRQAGVGFRPLGKWERMWARPRLPPTFPPQARALPSPASLWTQAAGLCAFPRQTPLACPTPSDSPLPWPPATAVSWQEGAQGCAEATEPGVQGLPARRVWSGGLPVSVPRLAGRQGPVAGTCWASPSPLAFGPFLSSHREVSGLTANEKGQPLAGGRPGSEGSGRGPLGHSPPA